MSLLLQLNGDLPEHFPGHERRLYLLTCRRRTCLRKQGSVRGFRGVRVSPVEEKAKSKGKGMEPNDRDEQITKGTQQNIGNNLFGTSATSSLNGNLNPFSTSSAQNTNPFSAPTNAITNTTANPFATTTTPLPPLTSLSSKPPQRPTTPDLPSTFASKARLSTPPPPPQPAPTETWPPQSSFPRPYPTSHLDADYETISKPPTPPIPPTANANTSPPTDDHLPPGVSPTPAPDDDDPSFESTLDKPFLRFADRLSQNPLQVLRYHFRGDPLLYSKTDPVGKLFSPPSASQTPNANANVNARITTVSSTTTTTTGKAGMMPGCGSCGAQRVFELQLTPRAIVELEEGAEVGLEGMEWGTVVLGVCGRDCEGRGVGGVGGEGEGRVGYVEEWVGVQWEERVGGGGGRR